MNIYACFIGVTDRDYNIFQFTAVWFKSVSVARRQNQSEICLWGNSADKSQQRAY